jgi:hypothetical protein
VVLILAINEPENIKFEIVLIYLTEKVIRLNLEINLSKKAYYDMTIKTFDSLGKLIGMNGK